MVAFLLVTYDNYIVLIVPLHVISSKIAYLAIMCLHNSSFFFYFFPVVVLISNALAFQENKMNLFVY